MVVVIYRSMYIVVFIIVAIYRSYVRPGILFKEMIASVKEDSMFIKELFLILDFNP